MSYCSAVSLPLLRILPFVDSNLIRQVIECFGFSSIRSWSTDMFLSFLVLSVSLSFFSSPVPHCSALEEFCSMFTILGSFEPRLLVSRWVANFVFRNQYRSGDSSSCALAYSSLVFCGFHFRINSLQGGCFHPDLVGLAGN